MTDFLPGAVPPEKLRQQAWKYYFVFLAWPVYLWLLPGIFSFLGWFSVIFMIFPGIFLFTWVGFLMHECWHKYVPNLSNTFFYNAFALMLFTDPQLYRLIHGHHHSEVNTYRDIEFHPLGEIKSLGWRRIYHFFEIVLGIAFIVAFTSRQVPKDERYKSKYRHSILAGSVAFWAVFLGGLGWLSHWAFGAGWRDIVLAYAVFIWICSVALHHSQLVEHGNLIAEGDWNQRNLKTRNLRSATLLERTFLFLTHSDAREHVLHHTKVTVHSRVFPGILPMPEEAVYISLREYSVILLDMLMGRPSAK